MDHSINRRDNPGYPLACTSLDSPPHSSASPRPSSCPYCGSDHSIYRCQQFRSLTVTDRKKFVGSSGICHNCLGTQHRVAQCRSQVCCLNCGMRHHTLLHSSHDSPARPSNSSSLPNLPSPISFHLPQRSRSPSPARAGGNFPLRRSRSPSPSRKSSTSTQ